MSTGGLETQPSATTYELEDLVVRAWEGRIRVPHFQRDFRWNSQDVLRLFDSIIRGYPIGSLLLWVRASEQATVTLGALVIDAPSGDNTLWVVDGQQRITSLANALHPEGSRRAPFTVSYDLRNNLFVSRPKQAEIYHIPLPVLFDLDRLIDWFSEVGESVKEYFPEARRVAKLLRQYKVPTYLVRQDDEAVLTSIFDRMNNYGKRLSRAEIFSALFAGPEKRAADDLTIPRIAEEIADRTGFGLIDSNTVLHAILARRGSDPTRDIRSEFDDSGRRSSPEFPGESRDSAYVQGKEALVRAVIFLQTEAGVPHISLLTYKALLVVLARFFAHFPEPASRNLKLLRRFYWRVSIDGPVVFKGSFTQMSRMLSAQVVPGDETTSAQGLVRAMGESTRTIPGADRFRTNEAVGKIILCSWWALRPRSPVSGEVYDASELAELLAEQSTAALAVHRIFSRRVNMLEQLWAANRIFVPSLTDSSDTFLEFFVTRPSTLTEAQWGAVLTSYCLDPHSLGLLNAGNRSEFLQVRQEAIRENLRSFVLRMTEWDYEDTPPLASLDFDLPDSDYVDG